MITLPIDPRGFGVVEWTQRMTLVLEPLGTIPRLDDPAEWKRWARYVIQNPKIAACQPPEPGAFEDWQEWAMRFNQTIYGLRT